MLDVMDFLLNTAFLIYAAIMLQRLDKFLSQKDDKSAEEKTDLHK